MSRKIFPIRPIKNIPPYEYRIKELYDRFPIVIQILYEAEKKEQEEDNEFRK